MTDHLRQQLQASLGANYTVERELGGGGMSRVFVARDDALDREVVVKVLAPELAAGVSAERFGREVKLAAALQEPHIVPLHSAGITADGLPWYTMPFVRGESLRARITRGATTPAEAVAILSDLAKALAYAHAQGVVHRDIKPENVLLSSGTAVVTDFGIAKALSASRTAEGNADASAATLTQLGTSIGTPAYMAPEQAAGDRDTDHRADLYAWGVVAYELLAERHPFAGKTSPQALMAAHFSEVPAPLPKALPSAVAALVMRCMEKDPARRPASAAELLAVLGGVATSSTTLAWRPRRRSMVLGLLALLVLLGAGLAWSRATRSGPNLTTVAVLPFVNVGGDPKEEYFSDGMTDELAHALTTLPGLHVAGRTSSYAFKGKNVAAAEIGRVLDVAGLVEGTVRRQGGRVRITAQLTGTRDGKVQWSDSYERATGDVFAVQDELTKAIVAAVTPTLRGAVPAAAIGEAPRGTRNADAYDLYLRGRYFWTRRGRENLVRAAGYFRDAIAADSGFARAWAGLAMTYSVFPNYARDSVDQTDTMPARSLAAATHAVSLDSTLADANAAMANALSASGRTLEAEPWYQRALAIEPRNATAHQWRGEDQLVLGHGDEAVAELRTAAALDPLSGPAYTDLGIALTAMRRFDEAFAMARRGAELGIPNAVVGQGLAHLFAGRPDSAIMYLTRARVAMGLPLGFRGELALAYAAEGRWGEVDRIRASIARRQDPSGLDAAVVALAEGDRAPLLRVLATPAGAHRWYLRYYSIGCYPMTDPLKDEPAFQALLARMHVVRCAGESPWPIKPRVP